MAQYSNDRITRIIKRYLPTKNIVKIIDRDNTCELIDNPFIIQAKVGGKRLKDVSLKRIKKKLGQEFSWIAFHEIDQYEFHPGVLTTMRDWNFDEIIDEVKFRGV